MKLRRRRNGDAAPVETPTLELGATSCVLATSIPKSGTHLVRELLTYLNRWRHIGHLHYTGGPQAAMTHRRFDEARENVTGQPEDLIAQLRDGLFLQAHCIWTPAVSAEVGRARRGRHLRTLFIQRDPRDVLVSLTRYLVRDGVGYRSPLDQTTREALTDGSMSPAEQLHYVIEHHPFSMYPDFARWRDDAHAYTLRFEDLAADFDRLNSPEVDPSERWGPTLRGMADHLGLRLSHINAGHLVSQVWGRGETATGDAAGRQRKFERHFDDSHHAAFDKAGGGEALRALGYS